MIRDLLRWLEWLETQAPTGIATCRLFVKFDFELLFYLVLIVLQKASNQIKFALLHSSSFFYDSSLDEFLTINSAGSLRFTFGMESACMALINSSMAIAANRL